MKRWVIIFGVMVLANGVKSAATSFLMDEYWRGYINGFGAALIAACVIKYLEETNYAPSP